MQFLWNLLPGAREARNDLVVGYGWLIAVGLWLGVPKLNSGPAHELASAVGAVGMAVAASVAAFLIGSFSGDLVRTFAPGLRGVQTFIDVLGTDPATMLEALNDKEAAELNRLEGAIDRTTAEVTFRWSLIPPILLGGIAAAFNSGWWWTLMTMAIALALTYQGNIRFRRSRDDIAASLAIRRQALMRGKPGEHSRP